MTAPQLVKPEEVLAAVTRLDTAAAHQTSTPWVDYGVVLRYARQAGRHPPRRECGRLVRPWAGIKVDPDLPPWRCRLDLDHRGDCSPLPEASPADQALPTARMGDLVPVPRGRLARWAEQVSTLAQHAIRSPNAVEAAHEMATDIARWACRLVEPADTPPPEVPR